jgi:hypothetical protein
MQPSNYTHDSNQRLSGWLRVIILGAVLVFMVLLGLFIMRTMKFHLIKTDPKLSAVASYTTDMTVYYNKPLDAKSIKLYDPGGMVSKTTVGSKTVTFKFRLALQVDRNYEFFIRSVKSTDGAELKDQSIKFTAKDIPFDKLSAAQQKKVVAQQDQYTYSVQNINYTGFDNLIDQGVTAGEVLDIQTNIYTYSNRVKQKFWTVPLDPNSLVIRFHDPTDREANSSSATFNVNLGGSIFSVRSEYDGISDTTYTRIFDAGGAVVFDNSAQ